MELNQKDISKQVIGMDKKYKTRDGIPVRVLCVDLIGDDDYPVLALALGSCGVEEVCSFSAKGEYIAGRVSNEDLVEVSSYDDFKVDDKVLVSQDGKHWYKRYFSHVTANSIPWAFDEGATSWSNPECASPWNFCKKAEE